MKSDLEYIHVKYYWKPISNTHLICVKFSFPKQNCLYSPNCVYMIFVAGFVTGTWKPPRVGYI